MREKYGTCELACCAAGLDGTFKSCHALDYDVLNAAGTHRRRRGLCRMSLSPAGGEDCGRLGADVP